MISFLLILITLNAFSIAAAQTDFKGGWASRELGGCQSEGVSCGVAASGFSACCPKGTFCKNTINIPGFTDTTGCCPTGDDCSSDLALYNVCANSEWSLYNNTGLPFCCLPGFKGGKGPGYDACRENGFPNSETPLPVEAPGQPLFAAVSTPSETPVQDASPSTGTPLGKTTVIPIPVPKGLTSGAMAGIVIGSIFGVILIGFAAWLIGQKAGQKTDSRMGGVSAGGQVRRIDSRPPPGYDSHQLQQHGYSRA